MRYIEWSYRRGEQIINGYQTEKQEIIEAIKAISFNHIVDVASKSGKRSKRGKIPIRGALNSFLEEEFLKRDWKGGHGGVRVFDSQDGPDTKVDFLKNRIAVEVAFTHSDFLANDLLKFQMLSYAHLDKIDVGVYIVMTKDLVDRHPDVNFEGSIGYDKVVKYLPEYRSAIQVPIYVLGLVE
jgi:hypothetical protein